MDDYCGAVPIVSRPTFFLRAVSGAALVLAASLGLGGCSKNPVTPTPVVPPPAPLTVICPAPLSQPSSSGLPVAVRYGTATAAGGTPPVQITCAPPSEPT